MEDSTIQATSPVKPKKHWTTIYIRFVIVFWLVVAGMATLGWVLKSGFLYGTISRDRFEQKVIGKGFIGVRNAVGAPDDMRTPGENVWWYYYNATRSPSGRVDPVTIVNFGVTGTVHQVAYP
jgi:hypothetical protein